RYPGTPKAVRRSEQPRMHARCLLDGARASREVVAHVGGRLEMQLAVVPAVIAYRMTLGRDARDELGPPVGVPAEDEERRVHAALPERVENARSRIGIRPVVEGERDGELAPPAGQVRDRGAKDRAISMKGAVCGAGGGGNSDADSEDHACAVTPLPTSEWYTSS